MTDEPWLDPSKGPTPAEVAFDYIKSPDFRVVWADGVVGSITPNGLVHFALYAERQAIPRRQVFAIDQIGEHGGKIGTEVLEKQITRGSIVREMACDVFISPQAAENLAKWLLERAEEIKKIQEETK
mgnify:FL=1|tara:strand:+ start:469 stop:849 length:381 start_codon:yes stop_codon:yes gene_type:complete